MNNQLCSCYVRQLFYAYKNMINKSVDDGFKVMETAEIKINIGDIDCNNLLNYVLF